MLGLDIGLSHRKPHVIAMREALERTGVWITLALAFNVGVCGVARCHGVFDGTQATLVKSSK
jgi:hypothetical protein